MMPVALTRPSPPSHLPVSLPAMPFSATLARFPFEVFYELHNILSALRGCLMEIEYLAFIPFIVLLKCLSLKQTRG